MLRGQLLLLTETGFFFECLFPCLSSISLETTRFNFFISFIFKTRRHTFNEDEQRNVVTRVHVTTTEDTLMPLSMPHPNVTHSAKRELAK